MQHYHLITGKLAANGVQRVVEDICARGTLTFSVEVLPITVAALMTTEWIARHMGELPAGVDEVIVPGYCRGDLQPIVDKVRVPVRRGPKDFRNLPRFLGKEQIGVGSYGAWDIEILAEINGAPELSFDTILAMANRLRDDGANVIDIGCLPGERWLRVGECVRMLRDAGHRVSIDSWDRKEVESAVRAGAELVLSVNASNREFAADWGCEVVVIPDDVASGAGLDESVALLADCKVKFRVDPILEPLGRGFAASLDRYIAARRTYPDLPLMMGIGNVTELSAVDSAGVNLLLIGLCQEMGITSVLTTQVISWAQSSVRECDVARRMMYHAVNLGTIPKNLPEDLVMLRDPPFMPTTEGELRELALQLRDRNLRIGLCDGAIHLLRRDAHLVEQDAFTLFERFQSLFPGELDASHAFYLGYEMAKAVTARTLGKEYRQDDALRWGILTVDETSHRGGVGE